MRTVYRGEEMKLTSSICLDGGETIGPPRRRRPLRSFPVIT